MKIEQNMSHACIIPCSAARLLRRALQQTTLPHALVLWAALSGSCFSQLAPAQTDHLRDAVLAPVPDQVRLSEILIATPQPYDRIQASEAEKKARELRAALRKGEKFDDLAKANSQGPSAKQGGGLGYFRRGQLAPAIEYLVFDMEVGEVSEVLRTKQGFVILEVTDRIGQRKNPIETSSKQLEWKEYVYPSAGFAITLPSDPKPHDDPTAPGVTAYTVHLVPRAVVTFRVVSYKQDCLTTQNKTRDLARRGAEPNLVKGSFKDVTVQGYSGLEWQTHVPAVGFAEFDRQVCVEGRFYMFGARWPVGKQMPQSVKRILNSV